MDVETQYGPARVHLHEVADPRGLLVLGHGAGGGVGAPDLVAAAKAAQSVQFSVALVEQPYRVAGRRSPAPAHQLDAAWLTVVEQIHGELPLVAGGRSSGGRVACRTVAEAGAAGVLCLAFPLEPPGRAVSRLEELDGVAVPTLVVQGIRDPFGMPPPAANRTVVKVQGDHSLKSDIAGVGAAVAGWLADHGDEIGRAP